MDDNGLIAVTVVGTDRKGIVAGVTRVLYEAGCNLLDATSSILRGHFSMMLILATPAELSAAELEERLAPIAEEMSLSVTAREVAEADTALPEPTHMVSVYGADHPGIVYKVAEHLAGNGVNITALSSRVIGSDAQPVYALILEVVAEGDVEAGIAALEQELGVDVTVQPVGSDLL
ncbi:MAG TPA: ACT domain-containing protein [Actinomycetota bacterium]|nr:ACT domain-containing protein [Actinomycetota bacterium]